MHFDLILSVWESIRRNCFCPLQFSHCFLHLKCSESFILCLIYSNRYCNAVPACLHQHVPALISIDRCRDSLYGQQCCPGVCPGIPACFRQICCIDDVTVVLNEWICCALRLIEVSFCCFRVTVRVRVTGRMLVSQPMRRTCTGCPYCKARIHK